MTEVARYDADRPIGPGVSIQDGKVRIAVGKDGDKKGGYIDLAFLEK